MAILYTSQPHEAWNKGKLIGQKKKFRKCCETSPERGNLRRLLLIASQP
jgi:hypothetical protein